MHVRRNLVDRFRPRRREKFKDTILVLDIPREDTRNGQLITGDHPPVSPSPWGEGRGEGGRLFHLTVLF